METACCSILVLLSRCKTLSLFFARSNPNEHDAPIQQVSLFRSPRSFKMSAVQGQAKADLDGRNRVPLHLPLMQLRRITTTKNGFLSSNALSVSTRRDHLPLPRDTTLVTSSAVALEVV